MATRLHCAEYKRDVEQKTHAKPCHNYSQFAYSMTRFKKMMADTRGGAGRPCGVEELSAITCRQTHWFDDKTGGVPRESGHGLQLLAPRPLTRTRRPPTGDLLFHRARTDLSGNQEEECDDELPRIHSPHHD
jgi:hypothetical protein